MLKECIVVLWAFLAAISLQQLHIPMDPVNDADGTIYIHVPTGRVQKDWPVDEIIPANNEHLEYESLEDIGAQVILNLV